MISIATSRDSSSGRSESSYMLGQQCSKLRVKSSKDYTHPCSHFAPPKLRDLDQVPPRDESSIQEIYLILLLVPRLASNLPKQASEQVHPRE